MSSIFQNKKISGPSQEFLDDCKKIEGLTRDEEIKYWLQNYYDVADESSSGVNATELGREELNQIANSEPEKKSDI